MSGKPSLLIAGSGTFESHALARWPGVRLVGSVRDLSLVEFIVSTSVVDLVAVDPTLSPKGETFQAWASRFRAGFPNVSLVVLEEGLQSGGALSVRTGEDGVKTNVLTSQTIVIWSPKGGVGKTFLATNLACAAAVATSGKAVLLDLDLCSGDVPVHLDLMHGPTITEVVPNLKDMRPDGLGKYAQRHVPSGLNVICSPRRPELYDLVNHEHVRCLLSLAAKKWGLVYVDTPPDITSDVVGECVDAASKVVLVVTQDIATLWQCKTAIDILMKLGLPGDSVAVVLNRVAKESIMPESKIQDFLGVDLAGSIPDDRKAVERSVYEGKPVVLYPKNEMADAIWQIAVRLTPGLPVEREELRPKKVRRGFFW